MADERLGPAIIISQMQRNSLTTSSDVRELHDLGYPEAQLPVDRSSPLPVPGCRDPGCQVGDQGFQRGFSAGEGCAATRRLCMKSNGAQSDRTSNSCTLPTTKVWSPVTCVRSTVQSK